MLVKYNWTYILWRIFENGIFQTNVCYKHSYTYDLSIIKIPGCENCHIRDISLMPDIVDTRPSLNIFMLYRQLFRLPILNE